MRTIFRMQDTKGATVHYADDEINSGLTKFCVEKGRVRYVIELRRRG
jgi:hypothetical protein